MHLKRRGFAVAESSRSYFATQSFESSDVDITLGTTHNKITTVRPGKDTPGRRLGSRLPTRAQDRDQARHDDVSRVIPREFPPRIPGAPEAEGGVGSA